jgi:hypothetical protein
MRVAKVLGTGLAIALFCLTAVSGAADRLVLGEMFTNWG